MRAHAQHLSTDLELASYSAAALGASLYIWARVLIKYCVNSESLFAIDAEGTSNPLVLNIIYILRLFKLQARVHVGTELTI